MPLDNVVVHVPRYVRGLGSRKTGQRRGSTSTLAQSTANGLIPSSWSLSRSAKRRIEVDG